MNNVSNFPQDTPANMPQRKDYRNIIIGVLAAGLMGVGGFMIADNKKSSETIHVQESKITAVTEEKSILQNNFDASLARLDSMSTVNTDLQGKLKSSSSEISKTKKEIRNILNKKNATASELGRAKQLIASLNEKIAGMEQEVARLTEENKTLNQDKITLIADKDKLTTDLTSTNEAKVNLEKKVDIASTLNATNIVITPINERKNGKEKVSTVAKRVDKLVVSFDVNNRIVQPGMTDVYVLVIGPDGNPVADKSGAGTFTTREEGEKSYTAKVQVDLETAKNKNVEFAFKPGSTFQRGSYKIMIYQNGFLIGQGVRELKKGGLFS